MSSSYYRGFTSVSHYVLSGTLLRVTFYFIRSIHETLSGRNSFYQYPGLHSQFPHGSHQKHFSSHRRQNELIFLVILTLLSGITGVLSFPRSPSLTGASSPLVHSSTPFYLSPCSEPPKPYRIRPWRFVRSDEAVQSESPLSCRTISSQHWRTFEPCAQHAKPSDFLLDFECHRTTVEHIYSVSS